MMQVARDLGTLWTTLQPPSDCTPSDREALLLEVATASAGAHAAWQSEQAVTSEVHSLTLPAAATLNYACQIVEQLSWFTVVLLFLMMFWHCLPCHG